MQARKRMSAWIVLILAIASAPCWASGGKEAVGAGGDAELTPAGQYPIAKSRLDLTFLAPAATFIQDYATNEFTRKMEKMTNIHINWKTIPNETEAISLVLASGESADAYLFAYLTQITGEQLEQYGVKEKMLLPLDELIQKYMPNCTAAVDKVANGWGLMRSTDGKIYSLPRIDYCQHCEHSAKMWINQVWLDKLGMKQPATTEEFYRMLKAFKGQDPNGNHKADEIPLIGAITGWQQYVECFLLNSFVYYDPNLPVLGFFVDKGKVESSLNKPGYKEGLKYLARLFKEGLIYEGSFTQDNQVVQKIVESGDVPVVGASTAGFGGMFCAQLGDERYREFRPISPLKGPSGFQNAPFLSWPIDVGQFVLNKKNVNPQATVRWADYLFTLEGSLEIRQGKKDVSWKWPGPNDKGWEGQPALWVQLKPWTELNPQNESFVEVGVWNFGQDFRPGCAAEQNVDLWSANGNEMMLYLVTEQLYRPYAHNDMALPPLKFAAEETLEVSMLKTELQKYMQKTQFDFITGNMDIDGDWAKYLEGLDKAGLGRLQATYQKAYNRQYKK